MGIFGKGGDKDKARQQPPPVTWVCGECGTVISAPTNTQLGWRVSTHIDTHKD